MKETILKILVLFSFATILTIFLALLLSLENFIYNL